MIISIEQRQGKLLISYIKKDGNIGFSQINIPPAHQYIYMYSNRGSIPGLQSWDFRPIRKVPSQYLNRARIQEFFMDAGEDNIKHLFEPNLPILSAIDIEVEVTDEGFAEPDLANNRITAISFSQYPNITVFGSKQLTSEQYKEIENDINEHIKSTHKQYNFVYKYHENEADMIYDFLYNYVRTAPLITGWNLWGYDWRYIMNRVKKLNMDVSYLSPTKQWYNHKIKDKNNNVIIKLPQHKLIVDYMAIYRKWDRSIEVKENDTLDFVADAALGIQKIKYPGTLQELYNKDYVKYIYYNAIDAVLVELLDIKLKTMSTFLNLGNITRVESMSAFSPIAMLETTLIRHAYKRGQVFPKRDERREQQSYEGAFVYDPDPNMYEWVASFDFASLYPSIMRQFKISIENFKHKNKNHEVKENEIKTSSGSVFDSSYEPLITEILTDYYQQRKNAKKVYLKAEKELNYLEHILTQREQDAHLSPLK